ncbi:DUF7487 domain-containing protein [Paenibacillus xylanexedens]|uniref:DUF7487 domain-containing protein n=1 Tax=Paenibacillus xylanexedens TaxID=528191 RepID=UPI000F539FCC|nr:hypothetical protein [Paenibacillus xylanexedens]RPK31852.1 hypothetical protein EDO6_02479 [Paenibacillus xylanexedens]
MLLTETVTVKTNPRSYKHYLNKGYSVKCGGTVCVKVEDLTPSSTVVVSVKCDYCSNVIDKKYYKYYRSHNKQSINKDCCSKCNMEKVKETNLLLYGEEHCMKVESIKNRAQQTNLTKYGFITPSSSDLVKNKVKSTNRNRYGVDYYSQTKEHIETVRNTCLRKYGVSAYSQTEECRIKIKNTCLKKYGVTHHTKLEKIQNKKRKTNLLKYGVENLLQDKEELKKRKIKATLTLSKNGTVNTSKQQLYLHRLIGGKINYPVDRIMIDILKDNIAIEYDGTGHDIPVKYGRVSKKEFNLKELKRDKFLNSRGYKVLRIKSLTQTKLPEDSIIVKLVNEATILFQNEDFKWFEINLDENCVRYKNVKIDYDFGALFEIKTIGA